MGLILGGVSASDLILDGQSVSLYVGGNPPTKVWPTSSTTVHITLGTGYQARDQFRAALTARGLDHTTVTEIPFEIKLVGTGSTTNMFRNCYALTSVPDMGTSNVTDMSQMFQSCRSLTSVPDLDTAQVTNMNSMFRDCYSLTTVPALDTSQVTNMGYMFVRCSALTSVPAMGTSNVTDMSGMFQNCSALTSVPDMGTSNVTNMGGMFLNCSALTDGNVRLIGRHPQVDTTYMIDGSGLTREPFYDAAGNPI